jgi:hypothetical protein
MVTVVHSEGFSNATARNAKMKTTTVIVTVMSAEIIASPVEITGITM